MIIRTRNKNEDENIVTIRVWENIEKIPGSSFVYGVGGYTEYSFRLTGYRIFLRNGIYSASDRIVYQRGEGIDYKSIETYIEAFKAGRDERLFNYIDSYVIQLVEISYDANSTYARNFISCLQNLLKNR